MKIKKFDEFLTESTKHKIDDVNKVIQYSFDINNLDNWRSLQMNIMNNKTELIKFCEKFSKETKVEELKGFQRESTDKSFDWVVNLNTDKYSVCGIKITHFPKMRIHEWEKWEDGYIETFLRTSHEMTDYFIWQYIPMKHLTEILTEFKDDFVFYESYLKPY
jgi:hypothetical protein